MKEIKRDRYLQQLIDRKQNGMIKVITGIRRCGKSYLMNTLFHNHLIKDGVDGSHVIRFAFDSADDLAEIGEDLIELKAKKQKVDPKKFLAYMRTQIKDDGIYYFLLDEVQNLGSFEAVLNGFLRHMNYDVYVTGSNSKFLSKDIITEFRGRGDEIRVRPLMFCEFYEAVGGDKDDALAEYMRYGGMPTVALAKTEEQKEQYLQALFENIYIRDLKERNNLNNSAEFDELINILASGIGSLTNPNKLANTFNSVKGIKINPATISNYIDYLEDAFMVEKAIRYDIKGNKYISTPIKYYFADLGLRNARINFRQQEATHLMENLIYLEMRNRGFNVDVGVVVKNEHDANGAGKKVQLEVDFVANKGYKRYYIQSVYDISNEEKMEQEKASLDRIDDSFQKVIIVMNGGKKYLNNKGYLIIRLIDFLLDENSLVI